MLMTCQRTGHRLATGTAATARVAGRCRLICVRSAHYRGVAPFRRLWRDGDMYHAASTGAGNPANPACLRGI